MVDIEEVFVTNLIKKHNGREEYRGFYTVGNRTYQDDGQIISDSIALDKEALEILRAKIMTILIDELSKKKLRNKSRQSKQTKLF
jgi:hypothetical protein